MAKTVRIARVSRDSSRSASARAVSIERRAMRAERMRASAPLNVERIVSELSNQGARGERA